MSVVGNFEIEQAIYRLFTEHPMRKFVKVEIGGFPPDTAPGINAAVMSGTFAVEGLDAYRQDLSITLLVMAANLRYESERRRLVHPLVEYVVQNLAGSDLGLDIDHLVPAGWDERTGLEHLQRGQIVFEVRFKTASRIPVFAIEDADPDLNSIFAEFRIDPNAQTTVELDLDQTGATP